VSVDLATLYRFVGRYVHIELPPTAAEAVVYGPGSMGGSGLVVEVRPQGSFQQCHEGRVETLVGREVVFDYGYSVIVTADSTVTIDDAAAITDFLVAAIRAGQTAEDVLARALDRARRHGGLPAGTVLPDVRALATLRRDLDAAVEFRIGDTSAPWIVGQPPPSVEVRPAGSGVWTVGHGRTLYGRAGSWGRDPERPEDLEWPRDKALEVAHALVAGEHGHHGD
jgi:hypothetical protein